MAARSPEKIEVIPDVYRMEFNDESSGDKHPWSQDVIRNPREKYKKQIKDMK